MRTSLMKLSRLASVRELATSMELDRIVVEERQDSGGWSLTSANPAESVGGPETS
jgi:hypothetical protein